MIDDARSWAWGQDVDTGLPSVAYWEQLTGTYTLHTLGSLEAVTC